MIRSFEGTVAADGQVDQSWDLKDDAGKKVAAGVYTVTLQSWNDKTVAVPYAVNVGLFSDPDVYERPADGIFRLEGRGYGHGHGMSQFGAEGAARQGQTRAQILAFYYPGTTVSTASATAKMRVSLAAGVRDTAAGQDVRFRPAPGLQVSEGSKTLVLPTTLGGKTVTSWRAYLTGGQARSLRLDRFVPGGARTGQVAPDPSASRPRPTAPTTSRVTLMRNTGSEVVYRGVVEAGPTRPPRS